MGQKSRIVVFVVVGLVSAFASTIASGSAQSAPAQPVSSKPKMTEGAFKNIQVLKGIPSDQLIPTMQFIATSLGVECDFCHVQGAFEKDDKQPKQNARKMMQMMFAINKDNFNGQREVTCYSCHRGATHPMGTPVIGEELAAAMHPEPAPAAVPNATRPTEDQIIQNYIRALGGADAIQKISSRVQHGTVNFGDRMLPIDLFIKGPDKRASVMHMPNGDSATVYDGHSGWLGAPGRPVREMSSSDLDGAKMDSDLYFPLHIKQMFNELHPAGTEKIGDRETYVISGLREGQPPVQLYFELQSGLLVRLLRYTETPLGRSPTQIDYADYRDAGGAKTPFRWTIARPSGRFTIQIEQTQQNVPVDDAKFAKPASEPPPAQKP